MSKENGLLRCAVEEGWDEHRAEFSKSVGELGVTMEKALDHLQSISSDMKDIKEGLLAPATGRDQIPVKTHDALINQFAKMAGKTYLAMGSVILALTVVIVFLLTGEQSGWIGGLHR